MKRIVSVVVIASLVVGTVTAAGPGYGTRDHEEILAALPIEPLNEAEIGALSYMTEEEKLARDVYTNLYEIWGVRTFDNIAAAEQQHIDSVVSLMERYDLTLPATMDTVGAFENDDLRALYSDLIASGSESVQAALEVGATIEDVALADLHRELEAVDNEDIQMVFRNLIAGSENHMRAFVGQLERYGIDYEPQYIEADYLESIVSDLDVRQGNRTMEQRGTRYAEQDGNRGRDRYDGRNGRDGRSTNRGNRWQRQS